MKVIRRIIIALVGGTVLLIGIAMIVLPGPAFIVIPTGLAILALEFAWARRWLDTARAYIAKKFPHKEKSRDSSSNFLAFLPPSKSE